MITQLYSDDESHERLYSQEMQSWLLDQPQDVWLLFVRGMNWDVYDRLIDRLIDEPKCDIAIAAVIFWMSDPAFCLRNPGSKYGRDCVRIIDNIRKGYYPNSELAQDREWDIVIGVQRYREGLLDPTVGGRTLDIPKILFGPFEGRRAALPDIDGETRRDLDEILDATTSTLWADEAQWRKGNSGHGKLTLPDVSVRPWEMLSDLTELDYIEKLYGPNDVLDAVVNWQKYVRAPIAPTEKQGRLSRLFGRLFRATTG